MIDCLVTDADLARRLAAREARAGERARVRCKRRSCRRMIPPGKRADAVWCSEQCKRAGRWEERDVLMREVRREVRTLAPTACPCGAALDTSLRPGPVPRQCARCYAREYMRRYRAAAREEGPRP
jgi:hypothetical protein